VLAVKTSAVVLPTVVLAYARYLAESNVPLPIVYLLSVENTSTSRPTLYQSRVHDESALADLVGVGESTSCPDPKPSHAQRDHEAHRDPHCVTSVDHFATLRAAFFFFSCARALR